MGKIKELMIETEDFMLANKNETKNKKNESNGQDFYESIDLFYGDRFQELISEVFGTMDDKNSDYYKKFT